MTNSIDVWESGIVAALYDGGEVTVAAAAALPEVGQVPEVIVYDHGEPLTVLSPAAARELAVLLIEAAAHADK